METDLTYTFPSEDGREQRLRFAVVRGARTTHEVEAYLPANYSVLDNREVDGKLVVLISGSDHAGWTLGDYVMPRFASGLMGVTEIKEAAWYNDPHFRSCTKMRVGQIVYCEGSSAIKGVVTSIDSDGGIHVAWQPCETVEQECDLITEGN